MNFPSSQEAIELSQDLANDREQLHRLGYRQELARRLSGFSNFAMSLSIICILAGGITSFHVGYCSVGGAAIGIGWPVVCLFSFIVALTMGQIASAFPTAGGLYHWASILGGRGWGWTTAWLNLAGLVSVLAAINVGLYQFTLGALVSIGWMSNESVSVVWQWISVALITAIQAFLNYRGIRITSKLIDFSGYWILVVATAITLGALMTAEQWHWSRLIEFQNLSGAAGGEVWPAQNSLAWLFILGLLMPAYTITGFDASAHAAEETIGAARNVPRGIVRSVIVSGIAGWFMLCALVIAIEEPTAVAERGSHAIFAIFESLFSDVARIAIYGGIAVAQFLCGLATVTSASRMTFAFARDGGLPFSNYFRHVGSHRTPGPAILGVCIASVLFTLYTPVYSTITLVCAILLYLSYVIPTALGFFAYGRSWKEMGPWQLGRLYRPLSLLAVVGCAVLIVIGMAPPNDRAIWIVGGFLMVLLLFWIGRAKQTFPGPPQIAGRMDSGASPVGSALND